MKIIHISDLHLGRTMNQLSLIEDQRYALLNQIVPIIKEKEADVLLISGDIYDNYNPSYEALELYDEFLKEVISLNVTVIAISGNHDSYMRVQHHKDLLKKAGYFVFASYEGKMEKIDLEDENGPIHFYLLPYLTPEIVAHFYKEETTPGTTYDEAVRIALSHEQINTKERNVILSHQYVDGSQREPSDITPLLGVGMSDAVSSHCYDAFDYVALGHIHKAYALENGRIVYPGALLPYAIDESNDRSVAFIQLEEKGNLKYEKIPYSPLRKVVKYSGTCDEILALPSNSQDYVFVSFLDDKTTPNLGTELHDKFKYYLGFERKTEFKVEGKSGYVNTVKPDDPLATIVRFYEEKTGAPISEKDEKLIHQILTDLLKEEA